MKNVTPKDWNKCDTQVFWGEIAPCNHIVQIYENDEIILDSIEGFVVSGFKAGDSTIIIATAEHLKALDTRLQKHNFNLDSLRRNHQFITRNAEEALAKFMVNGWPDESLFTQFVTEVVTLARGHTKRKVRAYGEMVAILWGQGHSGATVQLEHLWNKLCETEAFCLFCAYPKTGFTDDISNSIRHICSTHSQIMAGDTKSKNEVSYQAVVV